MIVRIFKPMSGNYTDAGCLDTLINMLWSADSQHNFHPNNRWINSTTSDSSKDRYDRVYRDVFVNWPGREPVIAFLSNSQVPYEVLSYSLLPHEEEALESEFFSDSGQEDKDRVADC